MIYLIPSRREWGLGLVRLSDSSVVASMYQMPKNCSRSTPITSKMGHKNRKNENISETRDQTEVVSTSNYNSYATECRGSLLNQNFIDLIQIISVFCNIYLLASPQS